MFYALLKSSRCIPQTQRPVGLLSLVKTFLILKMCIMYSMSMSKVLNRQGTHHLGMVDLCNSPSQPLEGL